MTTPQEYLETRIRLGRKAMFTEAAVLTPDMASLILDKYNIHNRPIYPKRVDAIIDEIEKGKWKLTFQGISFATTGELNNGQHRCAAVVKSNKSIQVMFGFGEDRAAFYVTDIGGKRTGADILYIMGESNCPQLAATTKALYCCLSDIPRHNAPVSNSTLLEVLANNHGLREAVTAGITISGHLRVSASGIALAYYLISQSKHNHRLTDFMVALQTGANLRDGSPILKLRNYLLKRGERFPHGGSSRIYIAAAIIKTWNAYIKGKTPRGVYWKDSETFPKAL